MWIFRLLSKSRLLSVMRRQPLTESVSNFLQFNDNAPIPLSVIALQLNKFRWTISVWYLEMAKSVLSDTFDTDARHNTCRCWNFCSKSSKHLSLNVTHPLKSSSSICEWWKTSDSRAPAVSQAQCESTSFLRRLHSIISGWIDFSSKLSQRLKLTSLNEWAFWNNNGIRRSFVSHRQLLKFAIFKFMQFSLNTLKQLVIFSSCPEMFSTFNTASSLSR